MGTGALRTRLAAALAFAPEARADFHERDVRVKDGYAERSVWLQVAGERIPGALLVPARPCGGAVVVHHQHHSQWHLGKSEVTGVAGDPLQAFGPALARRGVTVLAADAPGFEDRRLAAAGTDPRPEDGAAYERLLVHGLVTGRPLMARVLAEASAAHAALCALPDIDPARVGALGHSMGGATTFFHAAVNERVAFAAVSGAACTYRHRMSHGTGIEAAQVIPGVLGIGDLDDFVALLAPRPLLLCSATGDKYAADAPIIALAAARAYGQLDVSENLAHERFVGGHALTEERFALLVNWTARRCGSDGAV